MGLVLINAGWTVFSFIVLLSRVKDVSMQASEKFLFSIFISSVVMSLIKQLFGV